MVLFGNDGADFMGKGFGGESGRGREGAGNAEDGDGNMMTAEVLVNPQTGDLHQLVLTPKDDEGRELIRALLGWLITPRSKSLILMVEAAMWSVTLADHVTGKLGYLLVGGPVKVPDGVDGGVLLKKFHEHRMRPASHEDYRHAEGQDATTYTQARFRDNDGNGWTTGRLCGVRRTFAGGWLWLCETDMKWYKTCEIEKWDPPQDATS
jgi:hypothetical protein